MKQINEMNREELVEEINYIENFKESDPEMYEHCAAYLEDLKEALAKIATCGNCKNCSPLHICGGDCKCKAHSTAEITFEVSEDDEIAEYGEDDYDDCKYFAVR